MEQQLHTRLAKLKAEFEKGQKRLEELETETNHIRQTLLRISGAIQVLEEILTQTEGESTQASNSD